MSTINHSGSLAIKSIIGEMDRQDQIWGAQRDLHNYDFNLILSEEVGEVSEAAILAANALLGTKMGHVSKAVQGDAGTNLREELVQVAAVAAQWIEMIDRQAGKETSQC